MDEENQFKVLSVLRNFPLDKITGGKDCSRLKLHMVSDVYKKY